MSKFCPICKGEFHNNLNICPSDQAKLVDELLDDEILIDIYLAKDEIEAERIVSLLRSEGMKAEENRGGISQLPTVGDRVFVIMVAKSSYKEARMLIEQARHDQVISSFGNFM